MQPCFALASVFPPNGLDRSLHAAVVIGLCFITFFVETYGWTYAGLVVPGYLASVFAVAPVTGVFMVGEALVTHAVTVLLADWIPRKTGAWTSSFGRERFFLYVIVAILVRLGVEGTLVPLVVERYRLAHARELYSVGLVLVPLVANVFWNAGVAYSLPRLAVLTGLTYAAVELLLLRHTNYSLSRFLIANESTAFAFLASPKAYLLLACGALLAARHNVLHGWDYNGILVPALLAVAWYQPTKCVATFVESLFVYAAARALGSVGPIARRLVGTARRMLFVVVVGFVLKLAGAHFLWRLAPGVQIVDYFGFGYILPSLLAVKYWGKNHVGVVLMPALHVSLTAFVLGNAIGYGLRLLEPAPAEPVLPPPAIVAVNDVGLSLLLADSEPLAKEAGRESESSYEAAAAATARGLGELSQGDALSDDTLRAAAAVGVEVRRDNRGWIAVTRPAIDPEESRPAPRVALHARAATVVPRMVIVDAAAPGSPLCELGVQLGDWIEARAVVVLSRHPDVRAQDERTAALLAATLGAPQLLRLEASAIEASAEGGVESAANPAPTLEVIGAVPPGLDVQGIARHLGAPIGVRFLPDRGGGDPLARAPRLRVPLELAGAALGSVLPSPAVEHWPGGVRAAIEARERELTVVGADGYAEPLIEELRLFDAVLVPALEAAARGTAPGSWPRSLGGLLGYRFVAIGEVASPSAWALVEVGRERRGHASFFLRAGQVASDLAVEVPAPRWEVGTLTAGLALYDALAARALLVAGAMPHADALGRADPRLATGRRAYFQRIHEHWLSAGRHALSVQGITPERATDEDVVLSIGYELPSAADLPEWLAPVRGTFAQLDLRVGTVDGQREHIAFEATGDPTMAFALLFAPDRFALAWLAPRLRARLTELGRAPPPAALSELPSGRGDLARRAVLLARCSGKRPPRGCPEVLRRERGCDLAAAGSAAELYSRERNPFDRAALVEHAARCFVESYVDRESERAWLVVAAPGQVRLVPLAGGGLERPRAPLRELAEVRRAVALPLATVAVEAAP